MKNKLEKITGPVVTLIGAGLMYYCATNSSDQYQKERQYLSEGNKIEAVTCEESKARYNDGVIWSSIVFLLGAGSIAVIANKEEN